MTSKKQAKVGVGVFVFNPQGKIILGKRKGSHGAGEWSLPGGHLEWFEDMYSCVKRELEEETGMSVITEFRKLGFTEKFYSIEGKHYITLFFACKSNEEPKLIEPDKCEGWEWFDLMDLPSPLFCGTEEMIEKILIPEKKEAFWKEFHGKCLTCVHADKTNKKKTMICRNVHAITRNLGARGWGGGEAKMEVSKLFGCIHYSSIKDAK